MTNETETLPPKPWWESRTQVGVLVSSVAIALAWAGIQIDAAGLTELILLAAALAANARTWWGRVEANRPVDKTLVAPGIRIPWTDWIK